MVFIFFVSTPLWASSTGGHGGHELGVQFDSDFRDKISKATSQAATTFDRDLINKVFVAYKGLQISVVPTWPEAREDRYARITAGDNHALRIELADSLDKLPECEYEIYGCVRETKMGTVNSIFSILARQALGKPAKPEGLIEVIGAQCFFENLGQSHINPFENWPGTMEGLACQFYAEGYQPLSKVSQLGSNRFKYSREISSFLQNAPFIRIRVGSPGPGPNSIENQARSDSGELMTTVIEKALRSIEYEARSRLAVHEFLVLAGIDGDNVYTETSDVIERAKYGIPKCDLPDTAQAVDGRDLFKYKSSLVTVQTQIALGFVSADWGPVIQSANAYCSDMVNQALETSHIQCPANYKCNWDYKCSWPGSGLSDHCYFSDGVTLNRHSNNLQEFWALDNLHCAATYSATRATVHHFTPKEQCEKIQYCHQNYAKNPNLIQDDLTQLDVMSKKYQCP